MARKPSPVVATIPRGERCRPAWLSEHGSAVREPNAASAKPAHVKVQNKAD